MDSTSLKETLLVWARIAFFTSSSFCRPPKHELGPTKALRHAWTKRAATETAGHQSGTGSTLIIITKPASLNNQKPQETDKPGRRKRRGGNTRTHTAQEPQSTHKTTRKENAVLCHDHATIA